MTTPNITLVVDHDPAAAPATSEEIREALERQVAAKIVAMLPPADAAARRILAHAGLLFDQYMSIAAIRASEAAQ